MNAAISQGKSARETEVKLHGSQPKSGAAGIMALTAILEGQSTELNYRSALKSECQLRRSPKSWDG